MRIVCDTNVLISGVLFGGKPRRILSLAARGRITICISTAILAEVEEVLLRPKFALSPARISATLELFQQTFLHVSPSRHFQVVEDDPDDDAIIEAAVAANAEVIVTGDKHLLKIGKWREIEMLTPEGFLARRFPIP